MLGILVWCRCSCRGDSLVLFRIFSEGGSAGSTKGGKLFNLNISFPSSLKEPGLAALTK